VAARSVDGGGAVLWKWGVSENLPPQAQRCTLQAVEGT